jgi:hypothetical protein
VAFDVDLRFGPSASYVEEKVGRRSCGPRQVDARQFGDRVFEIRKVALLDGHASDTETVMLKAAVDNVVLSRAIMGTSLGFHIVFAVLGVGMPMLMSVAEGIGLWRHDPAWIALARRWAKAFALIFAVGAVSGTALSFELGLLWPGFMAFSGSIIGLPFSAEGFAFFLEAIFLGLYLYGWERLRPRSHWLTSIRL